MEQFQTITAEYRPVRTEDLVPGAEEFIGQVAEWQAVWIIEDGPYAGQWAMAHRGDPGWPFAWVPLCDLRLVYPVVPFRTSVSSPISLARYSEWTVLQG